MTNKFALISTSDKTNLIELAQELIKCGFGLIATGGTYQELTRLNVPVTHIKNYTGFPEILGGRVKTLHPKIFGGLLARKGNDQDKAALEQYRIPEIELLVVNLYPFQKVIENNPKHQLAIENIDIGGPALLRAAAKNYESVTVVVDPNDYKMVLKELKSSKHTTSLKTRLALAQKTFSHLARYNEIIANYLDKQQQKAKTPDQKTKKQQIKSESESKSDQDFPNTLSQQYTLRNTLRYGENPHQSAALYLNENQQYGIANAKQHQGKNLSFNNLQDATSAWRCVSDLEKPGCVIVKHATPCGAAIGQTDTEAYIKAFGADPISAFGGIVAFNSNLTAATAATLIKQQFAEVVIAPDFEAEVLEIFKAKPGLRLLTTKNIQVEHPQQYQWQSIDGGLLVQELNTTKTHSKDWEVVTTCKPTPQQWQDIIFAWRVVKHVKSNAIVYALNQQTLGIGSGQTSRVFSAEIAALKAAHMNLSLNQAVMSSDAFFPFPDAIELAAQHNISVIIQPGGSKNDEKVIAAAEKAGIAMVFTGIRHFCH